MSANARIGFVLEPGWMYLCIICLTGAEQRVQRIVARNDEASKVDKKLASDVEKDEEEIEADETEEGIDFRDRGLPLQIVEGRIL